MKVISYFVKGKMKTMSIDELKKLKVDLTQTWENACNKCGKCCFYKSTNENGRQYINYDKPCEHLQFIGKKANCKIYQDRFSKFDKCNTISDAIQKKYLPSDCSYIKNVVPYKAPVDNGEWYKRARKKLTARFDDDSTMFSGGDQPTGGSRNMPAPPPPRKTSMEAQNLVRESQGKDWKRRRRENELRSQGKAGMLDPREKTNYNIKPSGHAGGG